MIADYPIYSPPSTIAELSALESLFNEELRCQVSATDPQHHAVHEPKCTVTAVARFSACPTHRLNGMLLCQWARIEVTAYCIQPWVLCAFCDRRAGDCWTAVPL